MTEVLLGCHLATALMLVPSLLTSKAAKYLASCTDGCTFCYAGKAAKYLGNCTAAIVPFAVQARLQSTPGNCTDACTFCCAGKAAKYLGKLGKKIASNFGSSDQEPKSVSGARKVITEGDGDSAGEVAPLASGVVQRYSSMQRQVAVCQMSRQCTWSRVQQIASRELVIIAAQAPGKRLGNCWPQAH